MLRKTYQLLFATLLFAISTAYALTEQQLYDIGMKAYIYAYPLVLMDVTKQVATNVSVPIQKGTRFQAPINQFANMAMFPTSKFKDVVRPNADTLYSSAWLDLSKEPIILTVPDTHDRYYLMPMLSAWTDVFASPGKRTTGTQAGNFAIVGPHWKGTLPNNIKEIKAPTNMIWILGRTQTNGVSDYNFVHQIQAGYKLTPLSAWGKPYTPPTNLPVDYSTDVAMPPVTQVANMNASSFFKRFTTVLKNNPPQPQDNTMVEELKKIGIKPGNDFDATQFSKEQIKTLNHAIQAAQQKIAASIQTMGTQQNGWRLTPLIGKYGTHYLDRAGIDYAGLGANIPQDAIYPTAFIDSDEKPLNGKNNYIIHFNKNQLPPTNAFWSISLYDKNSFFVSNPINRYTIGDRDKLKLNKDGSLDLYIQHTAPNENQKANWLPAPEGEFNLTLRIYWPKQDVLNGKWKLPKIINQINLN